MSLTLGSLFDGIGGFPLAGERSGLFSQAIKIIYEMRKSTNGKYPTFIIWENVPGAFNSNKGHDFLQVLRQITKTDISMPECGKWAKSGMVQCGGVQVAWRQLDAHLIVTGTDIKCSVIV